MVDYPRLPPPSAPPEQYAQLRRELDEMKAAQAARAKSEIDDLRFKHTRLLGDLRDMQGALDNQRAQIKKLREDLHNARRDLGRQSPAKFVRQALLDRDAFVDAAQELLAARGATQKWEGMADRAADLTEVIKQVAKMIRELTRDKQSFVEWVSEFGAASDFVGALIVELKKRPRAVTPEEGLCALKEAARAKRFVPIILETDEDGHVTAECPIIPGCISQGRTREEALRNISEAIPLCTESMCEEEEGRADAVRKQVAHELRAVLVPISDKLNAFARVKQTDLAAAVERLLVFADKLALERVGITMTSVAVEPPAGAPYLAADPDTDEPPAELVQQAQVAEPRDFDDDVEDFDDDVRPLLKVKGGGLGYATDGASGLDLPTTRRRLLQRGEAYVIDTGIRVGIPEGYEGQVRPRSSASRDGLHVCFDTIDSDYRGPIKVLVRNMGEAIYELLPGKSVAQLVICPVARVWVHQVEQLSV
jgi:dUTP pyrophosphatase